LNKVTAISPANIAFIKYWGKAVPDLNIPFNDSISMNLDNCFTKTTTQFDPKLKEDVVIIGGIKAFGAKKERVVKILELVRGLSGIKAFARVESINNFPSDAGIASSASGFSALALSASRAAGLNLDKKALSRLARIGSGSACRSIPDGFTYWMRGGSDETSYAKMIAPPDFWDIRDVIAVTSSGAKKVGSTEGHEFARSSPYFEQRLKDIDKRVRDLKKALLSKDFEAFGRIVEEEAVDLHVIAMTSKPPIFYWNAGTMQVIEKVFDLREKGILCYFTMDAGPNVHVLCLGKDEAKVGGAIRRLPLVKLTIANKAGKGARIVK
jgi:diphosphomevalonate decarboxylase